MIDQEILDTQLESVRFPFPSQGDIALAYAMQTTHSVW
jgi:hypothetical protein